MHPSVIAFALSGLFTCLGMIIRTKSKFLSNMLVPVNVVAGIVGLIYMNSVNKYIFPTVTVIEFSSIVGILFTFSFISIGLASVEKKKKKGKEGKKKGGESIVKGAMGMGILWCMLFASTAVIGVICMKFFGSVFNVDPMYGMLIPYAFCQGPGQAANMGLIFETIYGLENAQQVAISFAVIGFISAFVIGIPLAKYGIKKQLSKANSKISPSVERGYFTLDEQRESMGKVTTHSGNIETLALHISIMGVCYLVANGISLVLKPIPVLGPTFSSLVFIWGMVAAYWIKALMRKFGVEYLLNRTLQNKITGFTSDFLVVCAFMAVSISILGEWLIPIILECIIVTLFTAFISIYFVSRLGSDHDFERVLGMFGMCTGTTPSGIALLRIVDPRLQTETATELGMTNLFMLLFIPVTVVVAFMGEGKIDLFICMLILAGMAFVYLFILKLLKLCNEPTFNLKTGSNFNKEDNSMGAGSTFVQGFLVEEGDNSGSIS